MPADPDSSCTESCTDSWHHSLGSLCAQATGRTSRSSSWATNSVCCADKSIRRDLTDDDRSLLGVIAAALGPATTYRLARDTRHTGLNSAGHQHSHRPRPSYAAWCSASHHRTRPARAPLEAIHIPGRIDCGRSWLAQYPTEIQKVLLRRRAPLQSRRPPLGDELRGRHRQSLSCIRPVTAGMKRRPRPRHGAAPA